MLEDLICDRFRQRVSFTDLFFSSTSSGVVQVLLTCLSKAALKHFRKLSKAVLKNLLKNEDEAATEEELGELLQSEAAVRLVEAILINSGDSPKLFKEICQKLFDGRLLVWARHPKGNFAVQRLLDSCADKEKVRFPYRYICETTMTFFSVQFEGWYAEELDENVEDLLSAGSPGVVVSVARACRRLSAKQSHFLVALMRALHCYEPAEQQTKVAPLLLR